jgi:hypothetical protein
MGGYYWRGKRVEKQQLKELEKNQRFQVIDTKPLEGKQPKE